MLNLKTTGAADFEKQLPKSGVTLATLVQMIDLGTSEKDYNGDKKLTRDLYLTFELPAQLASFGNNEDGTPKELQPFHIYKRYTQSLHPKSALHDLCTNMIDGSLPDTFDPFELVGHNLMINIVHVERDGNKHANIGSVMPLMEGIAGAEPIGKLVKFMIGATEGDSFESLPEWIRKVIEVSPEWKEFKLKVDETRTNSSFP